jgi:excisionase family DNA binding protein
MSPYLPAENEYSPHAKPKTSAFAFANANAEAVVEGAKALARRVFEEDSREEDLAVKIVELCGYIDAQDERIQRVIAEINTYIDAEKAELGSLTRNAKSSAGPSEASSEYLKIPEVARRLDVSEKTARRYIRSGELPSVFIGGAYRVREVDLASYQKDAIVKPEELADACRAARIAAFTSALYLLEDYSDGQAYRERSWETITRLTEETE